MKAGTAWGIAILAVLSLLLLPMAAAAVAAAQVQWSPRISIVWPHDGQAAPAPIVEGRAVNVSVWPSEAVPCGVAPDITLLQARNNEPAAAAGTGRLGLRTIEGFLTDPIRGNQGRVYPTMEYNDNPVDFRMDPTARYGFFTKWWTGQWARPSPPGRFPGFLPPTEMPSNVWVHAVDPRTFLPRPVAPAGYSEPAPAHVDARIQIVWPHDESGQFAPVDRATRVNVAVDIFAHGTMNSVPVDFPPGALEGAVAGPVALYIARGNGPLQQFTREGGPPVADFSQKTAYTVDGRQFPRWVFNDVPAEPGQQTHFAALLFGVENSPTVWTHAADTRTILASSQIPPPCVR